MKLREVTVKNFKRFTNLTICNVPATTRLIMLAGPNGCGKSSLFDAFSIWHRRTKRPQYNPGWEVDYHPKVDSLTDRYNDQVNIVFHQELPQREEEIKKLFYIRSAYRNDPQFRISELHRLGSVLDDEPVGRMIDNDAIVSRNFQRIVSQSITGLYDYKNDTMMVRQLRSQIIDEIKEALIRVFPDIELQGMVDPFEDGTFRFNKGSSKGFDYMNLSGGEKAVFDLILDIVIRKREYNNTIFCIDEPEAHMNARLQSELLSAFYDLIPENCQMILATHSIGMMRRARDIEREFPGAVVFLDFECKNFDIPQVIEPTATDRHFWERAHKVALGDLAALMSPSKVVICEGYPYTDPPTRNHNHDARCYNKIFEDAFPETKFISMGNNQQIEDDQGGLAKSLSLVLGGIEIVRLIDRDDQADETVEEKKANGIKVLSRRNLESYLYDDEVLIALAKSVKCEDKVDELLNEKQAILRSSSNRANDNLKPVAGKIFEKCKKVLSLTQRGNTKSEFARVTLAPLIKPGMDVYEQLQNDIFD